MKKTAITVFLISILFALNSAADATEHHQKGADLFKKHCSACHRKGAPSKPGVDILKTIRNPPMGMPRFDAVKISDADANELSSYIQQQSVKQVTGKD